MFTTLRGLILVLAVTLAVVPAAFGQSAGDDQYVDPFQQEAGGKQGGNGDNSGGSQDGSAPESTTDPTAAAEEPDTTSGGIGGVLPHTGLPLAGLVLTGALLFVGGAALRRRSRRDSTTDPTAGDTAGAGEPDTTAGGSGTATPHTGHSLLGLVLTGALLLAGSVALRRRA